MKKLLLFLTVLLSLALCSAALAGDYCLMDNYGCYVLDENGVQIYLMFWSEEARKAIMGDMSSPGDLVVDRPAGEADRMPLGVGKGSRTGNRSMTDSISGPECVDVVNWEMQAIQDDPTLQYTFGEAQCLIDLQSAIAMEASENCPGCILCFYNSVLNEWRPPVSNAEFVRLWSTKCGCWSF